MIPKIIHYCWFGGNPMPELAHKCISSWKKYLPDYEIKEWNEDNFDVNIIPYTAEAYNARKYAFVSDYARFWILYKYGGVYFDTDVEVIRPISVILNNGAFMGCECDGMSKVSPITVAPGLGLGVESGNKVYKKMLDLYSGLSFLQMDGSLNQKTVVQYMTEVLLEEGLKNVQGIQIVSGINIYPSEYFCPIDPATEELAITKNTYTIHHFSGSWLPIEQRLERKLWLLLHIRPHRFMWHVDRWLFRLFRIKR